MVVWDVAGRSPRKILEHEAAVYCAVFSPDGSQLWTSSGDGLITKWDPVSGKTLRQVRGHGDAVYALALSRDGKRLASVGGNGDGGDTACRLWNADTLEVMAQWQGHKLPVYGAAFSPDDKTLATASRDKTVRLWDVATGTSRVLTGHTSDVFRCAFSPMADGRWLATASQDATVRIWSVAEDRLARTLPGRKDPLYAVAYSPDGQWLAAVGDDRRLRSVRRVADYELVREERLSSEALFAVAFHRPAVPGGGRRRCTRLSDSLLSGVSFQLAADRASQAGSLRHGKIGRLFLGRPLARARRWPRGRACSKISRSCGICVGLARHCLAQEQHPHGFGGLSADTEDGIRRQAATEQPMVPLDLDDQAKCRRATDGYPQILAARTNPHLGLAAGGLPDRRSPGVEPSSRCRSGRGVCWRRAAW